MAILTFSLLNTVEEPALSDVMAPILLVAKAHRTRRVVSFLSELLRPHPTAARYERLFSKSQNYVAGAPSASGVPDRHRQRLQDRSASAASIRRMRCALRMALEAAFTTALGTPGERIEIRWGQAAAIQA
jgi:hypothetical protein